MRKVLFIIGLTLEVAGCNTTVAMKMPEMATAQSPLVAPHEQLAPIAFEKAIVSLKRGTPIAHFPALGNASFDATLCNQTYASNAVLEWGGGSTLLSGWSGEVAEVFNETLNDAGFEVVGDPQELFQVSQSRQAARYLVAAKIVELRGNLCEEHHWWDGRPLRRYAAEWYQDVEWSVYSSLERRVVGTFKTQGYARQGKATAEGVLATFNNAFASSAAALAHEKGFHDLIAGAGAEPQMASPKGFSPIALPFLPLRTQVLQVNIDNTIQATVTVRSGGGHGSGFVVSSDGHILTNHHVVGQASEVAVVFSSGVEITGEVVRSDPVRDVALIKVALRKLAALPIRRSAKLKRLDQVYAVGSPMDEALKSTVTQGVISALRTEKKTGLTLIQSDVDISGGNSGGPLLDTHGNVVGISVSGIGVEKLSSGLNFFIPIDSALEYLNLSVDQS